MEELKLELRLAEWRMTMQGNKFGYQVRVGDNVVYEDNVTWYVQTNCAREILKNGHPDAMIYKLNKATGTYEPDSKSMENMQARFMKAKAENVEAIRIREFADFAKALAVSVKKGEHTQEDLNGALTKINDLYELISAMSAPEPATNEEK